MEAHVIHPVLFQDIQNAFPRGVVDRRVARLREYGVFHRPAQMDRMPVYQDMIFAGRHFTHAEGRFFGMFVVVAGDGRMQLTAHVVEVRLEFIPQFYFFT